MPEILVHVEQTLLRRVYVICIDIYTIIELSRFFSKADIFYQPFFVKILLIIPQSINPHVKSNNKRYRRF